MLNHFFYWMRDTPFGNYMRDTQWAFSICESIHFIGLCLLFGALLVIDVRMLGFARGIKISAAMKLIPIAIFGFAINLITGICFIFVDPFQYFTNPVFLLKLGLIVLAGLNAIYHEVACKAHVCALPEGADTDTKTKMIAGASLLLWTLIILCGRLLPQFSIEG